MRAPAAALAIAVLACACEEQKPQGPAPSRFDSVKSDASTSKAARSFCEQTWKGGEGGKRYVELPERPIPGVPPKATTGGHWKWVNLWATWCLPCVEEMALLARWKGSLEKDGIPLDLELWSVDEDESALTAWLKKRSPPGRVRWLRSPDDLGAALTSLGADKASAIPVHALIDSDGNLRCLRVGSVHDEDYVAIKTLLSGR